MNYNKLMEEELIKIKENGKVPNILLHNEEAFATDR